FFFSSRRRHTRWPRDWSSDVCSSDLVRGSTEPTRVSWALPAACASGALAAIGGLWLWDPHGAWPEWYTFLWLPALAGAILPAPRRWALVVMAVVAGTAAALIAWGAAVEAGSRSPAVTR